jgi:hypothetical protein
LFGLVSSGLLLRGKRLWECRTCGFIGQPS